MTFQTFTKKILETPVNAYWYGSPAIFTILILLPLFTYAVCPCTYIPATLIKVLDGDTAWFLVNGKRTRINLAGIDAPELHQADADQHWCQEEGEKARHALEIVIQLLQSAKKVQLEVKSENPDGSIQAHVYADGKSVGQELLYKNLAVEGMEYDWCS